MSAAITNAGLFWGGLLGGAIGSVFVYCGIGAKPKYFWGSNKVIPMSVRRFLYLPLGVLFLIFSLKDLVRSLR